MPSRSGITRSSTTRSISRRRGRKLREGRLAAFGQQGAIAEPLDCILEQTPLDGVVVDDQDGAAHVFPCVAPPSAVSRFGAILTA